MKYIDAEKLKAEIERRRLSNRYIDTEGYEAELFKIIDSLQQEPQEEICSKCIHHGKNDDCYYPYGGMQWRVNENGVCECTGFCEKEHKQTEIDLEGEVKRIMLKLPFFLRGKDQIAFARHFYELGQREMRNRISNPEYNKQVVDKMKSEYPIAVNEEELKKAIKERYPMPEDADAHTRDRIAAARNGFLSGYSYELDRNTKKQ